MQYWNGPTPHPTTEPFHMPGTGQDEKEIRGQAFASGRVAREEPSEMPSESLLDLPPGRNREPAWTPSGRGSLMESVATSIWAWLVVGILSAWFSIWLLEAIGRLGSRIP